MRRYLKGIRVLVSLTPLVLGFLRDRKRWITVGGGQHAVPSGIMGGGRRS